MVCGYIFWGAYHGNKSDWQERTFSKLLRIPNNLRYILSILLLLLPGTIFLFILTPNVTFSLTVKLVFSIACIIWRGIIQIKEPTLKEFFRKIVITSVIFGTLFSLGQLFNQITHYPFSLGWSEGNRLWDYSIKYGSNRYITYDGNPIYAFLDKGRALVWGWIYLIPNIGIWGVRFWDAVIKSFPYFGLGLALVWPQRRNISKSSVILFALWTFLFIRQGPIHTPLVISAIFIVISVSIKNVGLSIILIIASAYLAEMTRFNWTYAPGLWAGMLALLQINNPSLVKNEAKKLFRPLIFGLAGYFGGQILPTIIDKINNPESEKSIEVIYDFQKSMVFKQILLWDRWLPNLTYGPGIILSLFIVALPVAIVLIYLFRSKKWQINWLQFIGVAIPGLAFLIVGLIASVKIGGGGDLHNMDMFLIFLVLLIGINWTKIWEIFLNFQNRLYPFLFVTILLVFPVFFSLRSGTPLILPNDYRVDEVLQIIQNEADEKQLNGGEVLFMDQRQLITFDYIKNVVLVDDYDKKVLINRTFANDPERFAIFYEDLSNQRFSLILSNILKDDLQYDNPFSEENNYWVEAVVLPILEYYRPSFTFEDLDIQLLVPIK